MSTCRIGAAGVVGRRAVAGPRPRSSAGYGSPRATRTRRRLARRPLTSLGRPRARAAGDGDVAERRDGRPARARARAATAAAPGSASTRAPGTRSARTRTPCTVCDRRPAALEQREQPGRVEPPGQRVAGTPPAVGVGRAACRASANWPARVRASDRGVAVGDQQAEQRRRGAAPRRSRPTARPTSSTCSRTPWQSDEVGDCRPGPRRRRSSASPWTARTLRRRPRPRGVERGERVGAGVDHRDPVTRTRPAGRRTRRCRRRRRARRAVARPRRWHRSASAVCRVSQTTATRAGTRRAGARRSPAAGRAGRRRPARAVGRHRRPRRAPLLRTVVPAAPVVRPSCRCSRARRASSARAARAGVPELARAASAAARRAAVLDVLARRA